MFYLQQDASETSHRHPPATLNTYGVENLAPAGLYLGRTGAQTQATEAACASRRGADGWISDVTTVPADPNGKRAHAVEVLHG